MQLPPEQLTVGFVPLPHVAVTSPLAGVFMKPEGASVNVGPLPETTLTVGEGVMLHERTRTLALHENWSEPEAPFLARKSTSLMPVPVKSEQVIVQSPEVGWSVDVGEHALLIDSPASAQA